MAAINTVLYAKVALIGLSCKGMYGAVFTQIIACVASVPAPKQTEFGQCVLVFRKMRREQKGGRKGVGEGKEGNACLQTPWFWKTPT